MEVLIKEEPSKKHGDLVVRVHSEESLADDLRREIELELYKKALIPESRGDVLGLIETIDKIPGNFETVCDMMFLQQIEVPKKLTRDFLLLIDTNIEAYDLIRELVMGFFYKKDNIEEIRRIDKKESESDAIERKLIGKIFKININKADKILLKEIAISIGNISDFTEIAGDRLTLATIKRQI